MLLPTKHIKPENAVIGVGADILSCLGRGKSTAVLFRDVQYLREEQGSAKIEFDWFLLALDFLFLTGAIRYRSGILEISDK